jgi:hypothetical protein
MMARKQPTSPDAYTAYLDSKGITYTVTGARKEATDYHEPQRRGRPAKLVPDARWADRPDFLNLESVFEVVPVKTKNPCNNRQAWYVVSKRAKAEHAAVEAVLIPHREKLALLATGCTITLTRISAGKLSIHDGLGPALKHIRDAIAMLMLGGTKGQRDEDERITWKLEQRTCGRGVSGVTILIEPRAEAANDATTH